MELKSREPLIFELSKPGRGAVTQYPPPVTGSAHVPAQLRRTMPPALPEVSELQAVRHFTRLSQMNFSIDTHFYPLGSCTMKYNPKACNTYAMLPEFLGRHPLGPGAAGIPGVHVRAAGDAAGDHRHAGGQPHADGRGAG